jgi:Peptidase A4 family
MIMSSQISAEDAAYLARMRTFDAPPPGFDPQTASEDHLLRYGFPRRPDPEKDPDLMRLWRRAFARVPQLQMVKAELEVDELMKQRHLLRRRETYFGPSGWGGVIVPTAALGFSPYQPANTVFAEWQVPTIYPIAGDPRTPLIVGFWVGLDGSDPTSYELLQAGTAATITGNNASYWAWTEWFTSEYRTPYKVINFQVQPGDLVSVLVCAPQPGQGFVSMLNHRTQQATSVGIPHPGSDITSVGARAEWIVEGISADLPDFSSVVFIDAIAGTQHHSFNLYPAGTITNITGSGGNALTQTFIGTATSAAVLWEGSA